MNQTLQNLINQIGFALPNLLVCLLAVVLAAINIRRAYIPSVVTLLASGMLVFLLLARISLSAIVYSSQQYRYLTYIYLITNAFEAIATGCLVVAIFIGRATPNSASTV